MFLDTGMVKNADCEITVLIEKIFTMFPTWSQLLQVVEFCWLTAKDGICYWTELKDSKSSMHCYFIYKSRFKERNCCLQ